VTVLARSAFRFPSQLALAGVVAAALTGASPAHADEPLAPESDTNPSRLPPPSTRVNLVLVGAAVTAGWYGASVGMSYLWPDSDVASPLRIPVVGPYMALGKTGCTDAEPDCTTVTVVFRTALTAISAVAQTGGVLAILEGAFVPTAAPRATSSDAPRDAAADRARSHVAVAPAPMGASGVGVGIYGDF
jgi:hypothetical protein